MLAANARVEELESESGDDRDREMMMDRRIFSDPLRFTGGDMAPRERRTYAYDDDSDSDDSGSDDSGISATQQALIDKEEMLVQSAMARIQRAREKGKTDVKLRKDELAALESRKKRLEAEAAVAAAKSRKSRGKSKKKNGSPPMVTVPLMQLEAQHSAASSRPASRRQDKQHYMNDALMAGPGVLVETADGKRVYQPINYPGSPSRPRSSSSMSTKSHSRPLPSYYQMTGRHASEGTRPPSSASQSSRPLPHEESWVDSRRSSLSGSSSGHYGHDPFDYQTRSGGTPPGMDDGRRYAGVQYSNIPRQIPGQFAHSFSDPTLMSTRRGAARREELADSSDELSDPTNGGVRVAGHQYVERVVMPQPTPVQQQQQVERKPVAEGKGKKGGKKKKR